MIETEGHKEALDAEKRDLELWPTAASEYGIDDLERDQDREFVRIDTLPAWPPGNDLRPGNHGLGSDINNAIGGGIAPGTLIGIAAAAAKSGKTAFIHQLADGLALRAAEVLAGKARGPLTPLIVLSEMDQRALAWRTLARWTGYAAAHFRAGKSADLAEGYKKAMRSAAREAFAEGSLLDRARKLTRIVKSQNSGKLLVGDLKYQISLLRDKYKEHEVLPIIMVDPIQRFMATGKTSANESMDEFANTLNEEARAGGWCVLLTSDATKATATGSTKGEDLSPEERGTAAFRGSYTLLHILDAALYLVPAETQPSAEKNGYRNLNVVSVSNRWGPLAKDVTVEFHGPSMRVYPLLSGSTQGPARSGVVMGAD